MNLESSVSRCSVYLSPCGRAKAAFGCRSWKKTPKRSFGYVASTDAIRVRGYAPSIDLNPSPQPSPTRGEGAHRHCRDSANSNYSFLLRRVQRFAERRIVGVALGAAAVERRLVRRVQRRAALEALD